MSLLHSIRSSFAVPLWCLSYAASYPIPALPHFEILTGGPTVRSPTSKIWRNFFLTSAPLLYYPTMSFFFFFFFHRLLMLPKVFFKRCYEDGQMRFGD